MFYTCGVVCRVADFQASLMVVQSLCGANLVPFLFT